MSTVEEMRQSLEPKKRLYCKRLQEPVITCNYKQSEYFGTGTEQKPCVLPQLQHILVMNPPLHRNNNGGHNKVEVNQEISKQDNILPASIIMMQSPANYLKEQIANGKCKDCEGTGYVFIEDSTSNCSMWWHWNPECEQSTSLECRM